MDYTGSFGPEFREVGEGRRDDKTTRVVRASRTYPTTQDDLWDAITNAERIPRWFLRISGDLQLGGRYQLEGNAGGTITRCDPPEALDVTWEFAGNVSWVSVRLAAEGDGTVLTVEHEVAKDPLTEMHWARYGPGAAGAGWDLSILGLGLHIETGQTVTGDAELARMASDEGMRYVAECAQAWAEAHIASGEDPETARAMAERTAAFYTPG